jgi:NAD(P)-dependent dehydrogenase (short-subunit alcohol dehydrogenase family)
MQTKQAPVHSGFGPTATARDALVGIDLSGEVAVVTGGYAGIGLETTRALAEAGATVIVPARTPEKARHALNGIPRVEQSTLDLLDPVSIDAFANEFLSSGRPLHILINNAGIMAAPLTRDGRGYESQFSTNHLGHFQLTARLWPALRTARGARVISVSSWGHRRSSVVFEDPNFERHDYDRWAAYGQSKTANFLFALELDERGKAEGVRSFSLHPGSIAGTGLGKYISREELRAFGVIDENGKPILDPAKNLKMPEQGAATSVWCATSPQLNGMGGVYCENCDISPLVPKEDASDASSQFSRALRQPSSTSLGVMPHAIDPAAAKQLWTLSERLTGVKFSAT